MLRTVTVLVVAGGVLLGAASAQAATASDCTYNSSNRNVIVNDHSGPAPLRIFRAAGSSEIRIADGSDPVGRACPIPNFAPQTANLSNTDRIAVFATAADSTGSSDPYVIDESNGAFGPGATIENDGNSEVEISIFTTGTSTPVQIIGTSGDDAVRIGRGGVNLGFRDTPASDQDVDITTSSKPVLLRASGGAGNDLLSGQGNGPGSNLPPADYRLSLSGDQGDDQLFSGANGFDFLAGGPGDDYYVATTATNDLLSELGGDGFDMAVTDPTDFLAGAFEQHFVSSSVGKLELAADPGPPAHVRIGWKHPKAWRDLSALELDLADGHSVRGSVIVDPVRGSVRARGVRLGASRVSHRGKWVHADLRLRLPRSLAGRDLRLQVVATDRDGRRQFEPTAGVLRMPR